MQWPHPLVYAYSGIINTSLQARYIWRHALHRTPKEYAADDNFALHVVQALLHAPSLTLRMASKSEPLRTKDAAIKSMSNGMAHCLMSSMSLSVRVGRSTTTPGRFTFLRSLNKSKRYTHTHTCSVYEHAQTSQDNRPRRQRCQKAREKG